MAKISKERLEKYRKLAEKGLWDIEHEGFNRFFSRAREENVELISNNFSTQGMFRAPHRKDLDGVDLAIVGVPLDLGVPNPRPGTRLGPEAVRYWSKDRNVVNYHTEVVPFDLCSIIDWGDVEFERDAYNLNACIDQLIETYCTFKDNNVATLTIDTDVFDCSVMPGTTLPEPFGLSGEEVRDIIRGLRGLNIVGADLMELSPPYDPTGMSACLASGIAFELLCLLAESRSIHSGVQRKTHWV